ncbi:hypothetical protein I203_103043 [Kwoniella mangroviensis CBS 8507]|uniref:uncharacterized protein n=1 Tax=Kwoniella mangroviensis CBS 8507 TaxID=1296122 RepID=UPI00080D5F45|nr:uncharacterized protein I203_04019 [Kwoniella mangroviensis CBS 8507]OCF67329.1 hypothetical protein I203_04019 [Kwoniella mangroviensis CBS 8507]
MTSSRHSSSEDPILNPSVAEPSTYSQAPIQDNSAESTSTSTQHAHPLQPSTSSRNASSPVPSPALAGDTGTRTRTGRRRQVTILPPLTTSALGDLSTSHPSSTSQGRRRAHTVGVSFRPRIPSDFFANASSNVNGNGKVEDERSDTLTPLNSIQRPSNTNASANVSPGDLEAGLAGTGGGGGKGRMRSTSNASRFSTTSAGRRSRRSSTPVEFDLTTRHQGGHEVHQLDDEMVGLLDCIDPTVSTVNHLQNMTNSVLVPHIPQLWKRRPEVQLPHTPSDESLASMNRPYESTSSTRQRPSTVRSRKGSISRFLPSRSPGPPPEVTRQQSTNTPADQWGGTQPIPIPEVEEPASPIDQDRGNDDNDTRLEVPLIQALPKTLQREEFEDDLEDIKEDHQLDKHVKHILRSSKRAKIMRGLKGVWAFVKTPMGFITAVYGFLVAFWGAGIVLFLLGWIPTSSKYRQDVWVEICSQVENGLFTVTGVGLIPWRVIDTYRMSVIWTLKNRDSRLRKKRGLAPIEDENDLPDPELIKDFVFVLSEKDQNNLKYQQEKFAISQTWYRPHATATHKAFPMKFALWNTILMDGNSFFQCGCMWGMDWHERPAWTTGCLIPLSFLCGIGAAVLIWQGSARTKKSALVSEKLRNALNVPVAIGIPRSVDGTVLVSNTNNAPATDIPLHKTESPNKPGAKTAGGGRRTTITFGSTNNHDEDESQRERKVEHKRDRGVTLAVTPEWKGDESAGGGGMDFGLGKVVSDRHDDEEGHGRDQGNEKDGNEHIALKEVEK